MENNDNDLQLKHVAAKPQLCRRYFLNTVKAAGIQGRIMYGEEKSILYTDSFNLQGA